MIYLRDAQGNVMAVYEHAIEENTTHLKLKEQHIYGSSRMGMKNCNREIIGAQAVSDVGTFALVRGEKSYELSNHLGNVLEVITDQKFAISDGGSGIDHFMAEVISYSDYYPFGAPMDNGSASTDRNWQADYRYGFNRKEKDTQGLGGGQSTYDYGFRIYNAALGKFLSVDPLAHERESLSPYNFCSNNPINRVDPTGALDDWVQDADGNVKWDDNANSQATTKAGETYLGKTLEFKFNSYIDKNLWDGPMGSLPAGDKLTSTISITGNENSKGQLTSITASKSVSVGETPVGSARDYYPGLGDGQNKFSLTTSSSGVNFNFEQHASVSSSEQFGMRLMGYNIVNVAQKLDINYSQGKLSVSSATDVFPSATLTMNGATIMQYNQPSFKATHSFPIKGWTSPSPYKDNLGPRPIYDYSYKPAVWYKR